MSRSVAHLEHAALQAKRGLMTAITDVAQKASDREDLVRGIRQATENALEVCCQEAGDDWKKVRTDDGVGAALEHAIEKDISSRKMCSAVRAYAIALGRLMIQQALEEERTSKTRRSPAAEADAFARRATSPQRFNNRRVRGRGLFNHDSTLPDLDALNSL